MGDEFPDEFNKPPENLIELVMQIHAMPKGRSRRELMQIIKCLHSKSNNPLTWNGHGYAEKSEHNCVECAKAYNNYGIYGGAPTRCDRYDILLPLSEIRQKIRRAKQPILI